MSANSSVLDPVTNLFVRNQICEEIIGSSYFRALGFQPITGVQLENPEALLYWSVYHGIYSTFQSSVFPFVYGPFRFQRFRGDGYTNSSEHVVVCLTKKSNTGHVIPYFISREYNLEASGTSSSPLLYKPGRFVFRDYQFPGIALAEEPAKAHVSPEFNVELYYISIRMEHEVGKKRSIYFYTSLSEVKSETNHSGRNFCSVYADCTSKSPYLCPPVRSILKK